MPQHGQYHTPVVEFAGWLVSTTYRPVKPLIELAEWFGIELLDAFERRMRWWRKWRNRWRMFFRRKFTPWRVVLVCAFVVCVVVAALAVT